MSGAARPRRSSISNAFELGPVEEPAATFEFSELLM